jgi:hypothetical protein
MGSSDPLKLEINELPEGLLSIGAEAFYHAGKNIKITKIPNGVKEIGRAAFEFCDNVKISEFGTNDGTGSQLEIIKSRAFASTGTGSEGAPLTSIYFKNSITTIEANAFLNCASNTLTNVYFAKTEADYAPMTFSTMGFTTLTVANGGITENYMGQ